MCSAILVVIVDRFLYVIDRDANQQEIVMTLEALQGRIKRDRD